MKIAAHPFVTCLAAGLVVISGACRKEEQNPSAAGSPPAVKPRERVREPDKAPVSDYQKKRISATLDSARKTGKSDEKVQGFEQLLQAFPSDTAFLHELALETSKASTETQMALAEAVVRRYRAGEYPRLGLAIEALGTQGTMKGIFIYHFTEALVAQQDLVVGAYKDLLRSPAKNVSPYNYEDIASAAALQLGYPEGLKLIPDIHDNSFGTAAARDIISNWVFNDPAAASLYVRNLPDSEFRNSLIVHLAERVAESQDFENAYAWANHLEGDWKGEALRLVRQQEDIFQQRNKQRSEREAQEATSK